MSLFNLFRKKRPDNNYNKEYESDSVKEPEKIEATKEELLPKELTLESVPQKAIDFYIQCYAEEDLQEELSDDYFYEIEPKPIDLSDIDQWKILNQNPQGKY